MKILFCDWNGTLLDDMVIWDKARQKTFLFFGVRPPTIEDHFRELESGDYLEVYRNRGITVSREELNETYKSEYEPLLPKIKLYPGIRAILFRLTERGVTLALITAQEEPLVVPLLEKFKIFSLFKHFAFHALDKKTIIAKIIKEENINPNECCFVGDSPSDMRHAKQAGVVAVAFLNGYITEKLMKEVGADHYIHGLEEILRLV